MNTITHTALGESDGVETPFPESPWVVMKFGGSSVASARNWEVIASLLKSRVAEGVRPVVCHSALQGISNQLVKLINQAIANEAVDETIAAVIEQHHELARELGVTNDVLDEYFASLRKLLYGVQLVGEASPRVYARIMATGELAATRLGAAYLSAQGLDIQWCDATTLLTAVTDSEQTERANFLTARCNYEPDPKLQARLADTNGIVLTQGFIASNSKGDVVLLGRGGSDTSGAYLAGKLEARRLEIWTDVPGFFSADPKTVPSARLIRRLQYREAQELALAGAGVLHPRSIAPVRTVGIPLFLKCTQHPDWPGSVISNVTGEDTPQLKGISHRNGITLISMESMEMWHQVGFLANAFECFRNHGVSVDLISTSESNVTVSIDVGTGAVDRDSIQALASDLRDLCRVSVIEDCAAITLVGRRIRTILHELSPALEAFEENRVHLVTQAANDLNITFVVGAEHAHRLVQQIHALLVQRFSGGVFGATWEQLTGYGAKTVAQSPTWWMKRHNELIAIAERHDSAYVYELANIRESVDALRSMANVDRIFYAMKANSQADVLREIFDGGINIECVSPGEVERARQAIPKIESKQILFTPNFAPRIEYEWALEQQLWLTLDNLHPLKHWAPLFDGAELIIRIDTGQGRGHHEHVKTAGTHSKFGVPLFECDELASLIKRCGARVVGLHAHTGSGVMNPRAWQATGEKLIQLREFFPDLRFLDLGGGLGVPERTGQQKLDIEALDTSIGELKSQCSDLEIWLEPGRFLVAASGVLLSRVTQLKGKGELRYLGLSTGMNSLIRPALYGAYHEIVNLTRIDAPATELTTIVGPICETGDRLGSDRMLPAAEEGDVILIANVGAYGRVMSSEYNLRAPSVEIVI